MSALHVRVRVAGEHYALPVENVLEVAPVGEVTPVPGAPAAVLGVRNLRGEVLPVVDLAAVLGLPAGSAPGRVVVAEAEAWRAALAVESVAGVEEIPGDVAPSESPMLSGAALVDGELVGVVDVAVALGAAVRTAVP